MKTGLAAAFVLPASILFYGCLKPEKYPIEPRIEFVSFQQINDSGRIAFNFTDGDGDIGYGDDETSENITIRYYEKVNGIWQIGSPLPFTYRTANLTPTGKNKALKGQIIIYMNPFRNPFSTDNDTIKYDIQMSDRADHLSNVVESNEIIVH